MHKQVLKSVLATLLASSSLAAEADSLSITITNIADAQGQLMIEVVAGESGFNEQQPPAASLILPAVQGSVTVSTDALGPGEYGIRMFHDQNANGKMDSNLVGIPKEPYGFSNSAKGSFGPPKWTAVKFTIDGDTEQTIDLAR
jgi:uncharacterized protein (DUF2141 family)